MRSPLVFVHIPKTAGTSFRVAMEKVLGASSVCRDYGASSGVTSEIVKQWFYDSRDLWSFKRDFEARRYKLLAGHFHVNRYAALYGMGAVITFLRDPVRRIVSEYRHSVIHNGYTECFETYYRSPENINRQLQLMSGLPWPAIGFIGLTERYEESLEIFNKKFGLGVPLLEENLGCDSVESHSGLSVDQQAELRRLNAEDYRFYDRVALQLDWRSKLSREGASFVFGALQHEVNGRLVGWALDEQRHSPVVVRISVGGETIAEVSSTEERGGLRAWGVGRQGYVGFSVDVRDIAHNERIHCSVAATGQPLMGSPWIRKISS